MKMQILFDEEAHERFEELSESGLSDASVMLQMMSECGESVNVDKDTGMTDRQDEMNEKLDLICEKLGIEVGSEEEIEETEELETEPANQIDELN